MRRILSVLALVALAAACGSGGDVPIPVETPVATPTADGTPTPAPTPTPTPEPAVAPLTGLEVDDAAALERPVFAVKIDNNRNALPQSGIEQADIAINELVEGGTTRFIALFHSTDPGDIGPVRSGREVDALLMPAFDPVFGFSGAASEVVAQLQGAGLFLRTEGDGGWYRRSRPGVAREHTLYATVADQWAAGLDQRPAAERPWAIDGTPLDGGTEVDGADLVYSPATTVSWQWDGERFVRQQYGAPHVTESGEQVGAANVVVPRVAVSPGPRGGGTVLIDVVGEGDAQVFRDGQVYDARWRKESAGAQFEWLTPAGDPLPLAPGQTWVELVPLQGDVRVHAPAGAPQTEG